MKNIQINPNYKNFLFEDTPNLPKFYRLDITITSNMYSTKVVFTTNTYHKLTLLSISMVPVALILENNMPEKWLATIINNCGLVGVISNKDYLGGFKLAEGLYYTSTIGYLDRNPYVKIYPFDVFVKKESVKNIVDLYNDGKCLYFYYFDYKFILETYVLSDFINDKFIKFSIRKIDGAKNICLGEKLYLTFGVS